MKTNTIDHRTGERTHEGAPAARLTIDQQLRRSVLSNLLWENEFYEDGVSIADRILGLVQASSPETVALLAIEARERFNLRHVPLLLLVGLLQRRVGQSYVGETIARVLQRGDEPGELLSLYWKINGKDAPLAKQLKLGLAMAFPGFDAYQLAKYDRDAAVRLRDVMFLAHPKPKDDEQTGLWKTLADRNARLPVPDTWEVALSGGEDKREAFTRLLTEQKLGYLALLRNLRNMVQAGVDDGLVKSSILLRRGGAERVLPFRYVAAARAAPQFEKELHHALLACIGEMDPLPGKTIVLVDVSGSMDAKLSAKSDLSRLDAAATLASVIPAKDLRVFSFSHHCVEVPPRRGMAGVDAIRSSQPHGGTMLNEALSVVTRNQHDRLIVITDEQSHQAVGGPPHRGYMVNVASAKNGVGHGPWNRIDGFSEQIIRYIAEVERAGLD